MIDRVNLIYLTDPGVSFGELEEYLHKEGIQVCSKIVTARSDFDNLLKEQPGWDAVLYDDGAAAWNTDAVLAILQEDARIHRLPLIILSRDKDLERAVCLLNNGAFRYIPFSEFPLISEAIRSAVLVKNQWNNWEQAENDLLKTRTMYRAAEDTSRKIEERYSTLAENARDSIFEFTRDGYLVYLNNYATEVYGLPASALVGKHLSDLFPPQRAQQMLENIRHVYETGEPFYSVGDYPFKEGVKYLSTWLVPFKNKDGVCQSVLGFSRDYSEVKEAEEKLKEAFEKQKELHDLQTNFVMRTSHEFRTPLSAILTSAELLEIYGQQWPQEKVLTHLRRIQGSVKHLNHLMDDLLIIEKSEAASLRCDPNPIDLVSYFNQLVEEVQLGDKNQHRVYFNLSGLCASAVMDEKLLRQVVVNLLVNSLKFSPNGTDIKVDLTCKKDCAVITIEDHGIGIPVEDRAHLFNRFYRGSNVVQVPGSGLGLIIVKEAVDLMEGNISFTSQLGVGTVFTIELPLSQKPK